METFRVLYRMLWCVAACLLGVAGWCDGAHAQQVYSITDLGTLGGIVPGTASGNTSGFAINSSGQVTGASLVPTCCTPQAFLYSNGAMNDLGLLANPNSLPSLGYGINALGQVVGRIGATSDYSYEGRAFSYKDGVLTDLGPYVGNSSVAYGVNSSGQITGYQQLSGIDASGFTILYDRAFLYSNGNTITVPLPATSGSRFDSANGFAINSSGQIAGISQEAGYGNRPFLYDGSNAIDLGTLGGDDGAAFAINDAGQITGYSTYPPDPQGGCCIVRAILYDGTLHDLGVLPSDTGSIGYGINSLGQIVGSSCTCSPQAGEFTGGPSYPARAFLYMNGAMIDLNTRIDPTSALAPYVTLTQGRAINGSGVIVALGNDSRLNGVENGYPVVLTHTYLLTPIAPVVTLGVSLASPPSKDASGQYLATLSVANSGNSAANDASVVSAAILVNQGGRAVSLGASTPLPAPLGAIAPRNPVSFGLTFPALTGASGMPAVLRWTVVNSAGSASGTLRLTLP